MSARYRVFEKLKGTGTIRLLRHMLVQSVASVSLTSLEISYSVTASNRQLISVNKRNFWKKYTCICALSWYSFVPNFRVAHL